jgi:hypothetical protein
MVHDQQLTLRGENMVYLRNIGLMTISLFFLFGCTPKQVVKQESIPGTQTTQNSQSINTVTDTLLYTIEFADGLERDKFVKKFKEFINDYPFTHVQSTGYNSVAIRIQPPNGTLSDSLHQGAFPDNFALSTDSIMVSNVNHSTDITITGKDTIYTQYAPDTDLPVNGGSVRLYTQRSFFDDYLIALVSTFPFDRNGTSGILAVTEQSARRVTIKINGRITNGKGKVISALDIIDSWTNFVKTQPAEGFALFRQVEGMREFIDGREAVIRGLVATDQNTVQLRLLQPDPDIVDRLSTGRLLGAALKTGIYFEDSQGGEDKVYLSNKSSGNTSGYLDKLIVRQGGDVNPVLSFSLKKYDAIELNMISDLNYARTSLLKNSKLEIFGHDRYFISFNVKEQKARHYLSSLVNTQEILKNFVKAEGECIAAIETVGSGVMQIPPGAMHPGMIQPVKVLFRKDDPISKIIAEKLIADFSKGNISCNLSACSMLEYEKALVTRNFGCAVGWVSDDIMSEQSEKIRLATMWFTDVLDEKARMDAFMELPLFSINRYLLLRTNIGMPSNKIQNLFINTAK